MKIQATIEISEKSRTKYEIDHISGNIRLDRILHSNMYYPTNYGFISNTLGLDGDPLDILVFCSEPLIPGCIVDVNIIGVLKMEDEKGIDDKILSVATYDPIWNKIRDLNDVNEHILKTLKYFFLRYKDLESKKCEVIGYLDKSHAIRIIQECIDRYLENNRQ